MDDLRALVRRFPRAGVLRAIWLRPARGVAARSVDEAVAIVGRGLDGDRTATRTSTGPGGSRRQVTMIEAEHLPLIAAWTGRAALDGALLRRNLVVDGINLHAARSPFADVSLVVRIGGEAVFVVTGDCAPCSKMEDALGPGGYNAVRGHGGVTARVMAGGTIRVGDAVRIATDASTEAAGARRSVS